MTTSNLISTSLGVSITQSCRMRVNWIRYVGGSRVRIAHKISASEYNFQIDVTYASTTIRSTFHSDAHIWITSSQGVFWFEFSFYLFQEWFLLTSWVNICDKLQMRIRWTACILVNRIDSSFFLVEELKENKMMVSILRYNFATRRAFERCRLKCVSSCRSLSAASTASGDLLRVIADV